MHEKRQSFHQRIGEFESAVRTLAEQIESQGQIQTSAWKQTLQRLLQIQQQSQSIQPVSHELAELERAGLSLIEMQTIRTSHDAHRQRLNT